MYHFAQMHNHYIIIYFKADAFVSQDPSHYDFAFNENYEKCDLG